MQTDSKSTDNSIIGEVESNKRPTHKRRRAIIAQCTNTSDEPQCCIIEKLPLELLAEILLFTGSPKDVLAFARCNKFFCATLLNNSSSFIWRGVRKAYPVPPPEPISTFSESSYAAFLFDGGICEICKEETNSIYVSFGIRLRLCHRLQCMTKYRESRVLASSMHLLQLSASSEKLNIQKCLPYVEANRCFSPPLGHPEIRFHRKTDWEREHKNFTSDPDTYATRNADKMAYTTEYMALSKALYEWKELHQASVKSIRLANEAFAKSLSEKYGWDCWDLLNCTPYGAHHQFKNKRLEKVVQTDYDRIASQIDEALVLLAEKRKRRSRETAYQKNREDVSRHYDRLRSQVMRIPLPPLAIFRRLPIVSALQASPSTAESTSDIYKTFEKTPWVARRLDVELEKWTEEAKSALGAILGYPNWKSASTKILHPVDRLTARFLCMACSRVAIRYKDDESLDFVGACAHQCARSKKGKRSEDTWDAGRFVKDEKAIAAMSRLLSLHGIDPADGNTKNAVNNQYIQCMSCESGILMGSRDVVGHSHRHEDMRMRLPSTIETENFKNYEHMHSIVRRLTGPENSAKTLREKVEFGCRHCLFRTLLVKNPGSGEADLNRDHDDSETKMQKRKIRKEPTTRFSFNGLRSHLNEKHHFKSIRDEDVHVYEPHSMTMRKWLETSTV